MTIRDWDNEEAGIAAQLTTMQPVYDLSDVLIFSSETRLLSYQDAGGTADTGHILLVKGVVRQHFRAGTDDDWLAVLMAIDGKRSLGAILQAGDIEESAIRSRLSEALAQKLLQRLDS